MSYDDETSSSVPPKNGGQRGVVGEVSAEWWDAVTRDGSSCFFSPMYTM